ncbi:RNA polymerase subunit sigma-70 [Pseudomonas rhizosphaerae]|uniref:RNA polymerase subunit sigma-70 n=2 Tax=Pseudomonas rhizosphaerae TaxID=216142 RepID=A0A089ZQS5_9PSED|nr:RNA polymerase subunit sigma-70 [Pseudomonas rhizosphaerae]
MSERSEQVEPMNTEELASEYVLGTLDAERRAEVERRLPVDLELRTAVDAWEARLLPLAERITPVPTPATLWPRIQRSLDSAGAQPTPIWWNRLGVWRGLAGAGLAASLVLGGLLFNVRAPVPGPAYVVVLIAPQDKAPGWVVQASDSKEVQLIPLNDATVPADRALQFWTKADSWQGPVSLGLVEPGQSVHVPLDKLPPLENNQLFELTLEPKSGSTTGRPTGPIQFIGRAVKVI